MADFFFFLQIIAIFLIMLLMLTWNNRLSVLDGSVLKVMLVKTDATHHYSILNQQGGWMSHITQPDEVI